MDAADIRDTFKRNAPNRIPMELNSFELSDLTKQILGDAVIAAAPTISVAVQELIAGGHLALDQAVGRDGVSIYALPEHDSLRGLVIESERGRSIFLLRMGNNLLPADELWTRKLVGNFERVASDAELADFLAEQREKISEASFVLGDSPATVWKTHCGLDRPYQRRLQVNASNPYQRSNSEPGAEVWCRGNYNGGGQGMGSWYHGFQDLLVGLSALGLSERYAADAQEFCLRNFYSSVDKEGTLEGYAVANELGLRALQKDRGIPGTSVINLMTSMETLRQVGDIQRGMPQLLRVLSELRQFADEEPSIPVHSHNDGRTQCYLVDGALGGEGDAVGLGSDNGNFLAAISRDRQSLSLFKAGPGRIKPEDWSVLLAENPAPWLRFGFQDGVAKHADGFTASIDYRDIRAWSEVEGLIATSDACLREDRKTATARASAEVDLDPAM